MRSRLPGSRIVPMTEGPIRLTLELDSVDEPISGRTLQDDGSTRPFVGWLGLAGALRSAFASHTRVSVAQPPPTEPADRPGRAL